MDIYLKMEPVTAPKRWDNPQDTDIPEKQFNESIIVFFSLEKLAVSNSRVVIRPHGI